MHAAQAEALIRDVVRDDVLSGAVLWGVPDMPRTRLRIGSMSKVFTAAAVAGT